MKAIMWIVILLVIFIGGYLFLRQGGTGGTSDMGSYAYTCTNGAGFTMVPASDIRSIKLSAGSQGIFTGDVTLVNSGSAARFEGMSGASAVTFVGAGEEVQLTVGSENAICNPVPSVDSPPWNWGDAGEGGGIKPDVSLVVSESIVGKWQSVDDAKFTREFKADGTTVDTYGGKEKTDGVWKVFTKENPLDAAFSIEADKVYIQMTMAGTQADKLNFGLIKLTPEELELIYMDRGGVLKFTRVE